MNAPAIALASVRELTLQEKIVNWSRHCVNKFKPRGKSNLVLHAEHELRLAGLFSKDSDYGGMIGEAVMKMVKVVSEEGHSGMSHSMTMAIFNIVANYKTLSPLTDDHTEWHEIGKDMMPEGEKTCWQNRRQSSCFSHDGGKTYYDIDDEKREIKTSATKKVSA